MDKERKSMKIYRDSVKIEYNKDFMPINLEEYPAEDLFEDGELTSDQVEKKIIDEWYDGSIILMRRKYNDKEAY